MVIQILKLKKNFYTLKGNIMSGKNNSPTNRAVRRASALARFSIDPSKAEDKSYLERKAVEKAALERTYR
jgi:hypothetical protein